MGQITGDKINQDKGSLAGDCQRELADILSLEGLCLSRLKQSMEHEQTALETCQVEALEQAVKDKQKALDETTQLRSRRAKLLQQYGFTNDESGIHQCIKRCNPTLSKELVPLWKQLDISMKQCRDQNLINGKILDLNSRCIQQTLAILRNGTQPVELYSHHGISSRQGNSTSFARA